MAPRQAKDCASMEEVRAEIDRIDSGLVDLIGERFGFVDRAWQLKRSPAEARCSTGSSHSPERSRHAVEKVTGARSEADSPEGK